MREKNRKQRKARWIYVKNAYRRLPECVEGEAFCDYIYEEETPWQWVDFRFLSKRHSRRYFAVAMNTLHYQGATLAEARAEDLADAEFPLPEDGWFFSRPAGQRNYDVSTTIEYRTQFERWHSAFERHLERLLLEPVTLRPNIKVRPEYGPVGVGLWVTLNRPHLNPTALNEFIQQFRGLGEPLNAGVVWQGEEVTVVPAEIYRGA